VLSLYGESFFRGALYGCQSYAPAAFQIVITEIDTSTNLEGTGYSSNLTDQYAGTGVQDAMDAGNDGLGVDYNLFGLLLSLGVVGMVVVASVVISGDWWGSLSNGVARWWYLPAWLYLNGLLALVAALCWLFLSAKDVEGV
jgi:hypothetical protein